MVEGGMDDGLSSHYGSWISCLETFEEVEVFSDSKWIYQISQGNMDERGH